MRSIYCFLFVALTLSLVGCDHLTKQIAVDSFQETPRILMSGIVELTYTENRDMAFGLLSPFLSEEFRLWMLTGFKIVAVLAAVVFWIRRRDISSITEQVALSLVLSGALGNLIDRLTRGYVVDFVKLPHWPVFNVADIAIVVGMGLFMVVLHNQEPAAEQ